MKVYKYRYITAEMVRQGESQSTLAELLNMTEMTLRQKLDGITDWKISEIEKICKHYKKDYYELFRME